MAMKPPQETTPYSDLTPKQKRIVDTAAAFPKASMTQVAEVANADPSYPGGVLKDYDGLVEERRKFFNGYNFNFEALQEHLCELTNGGEINPTHLQYGGTTYSAQESKAIVQAVSRDPDAPDGLFEKVLESYHMSFNNGTITE